jgi:hypothetical protein
VQQLYETLQALEKARNDSWGRGLAGWGGGREGPSPTAACRCKFCRARALAALRLGSPAALPSPPCRPRLWFKTNLKLCGLWFKMREYGRMGKVLKELHR